MINYNNHNITAMTYDSHTIRKVYGCDGQVVWEKPLDCTGVSFSDILDNSTTARTRNNIYITPILSGVNTVTIDMSVTAYSPDHLYIYISFRNDANDAWVAFTSYYYNTYSQKLCQHHDIKYSKNWAYQKPYYIESALRDGVSWITRDPNNPNLVTIDFSQLYDGNFTCDGWQYHFVTDIISSICYDAPPTPSFEGKWLATYSDSHTSSAECDATSAITQYEASSTNIRTIDVGNCVTAITDSSFRGYHTLSSCTLGDNVTTIGNSAFTLCNQLTTLTLPNSVTTIGDYAFSECSGLTSMVIPDNVTSVGEHSFWGCYSLTSCTLGYNVATIGSMAFSYCSGLTSMVIPDSVTSIGNGAFYYCTGLASCTIGSGLTSLPTSLFSNCSSLSSITIPNNVTTIGIGAFNGCSSLRSVTVNATTPPTIGARVFENLSSRLKIYVPDASVNAYKSATNWKTWASKIYPISQKP